MGHQTNGIELPGHPPRSALGEPRASAGEGRIAHTRAQWARRARQLRSTWQHEGMGGLSRLARAAVAGALAPDAAVLPVRSADVLAADLSQPFAPVIPVLRAGEPLRVNWVTTPPSPGSGGHSTLFRVIRYLQAHGCDNRVYFYDVYGGDHRYHADVVRDVYGFAGPVLPLDGAMADAHAVVATAWPTAYPVFNARCSGKRYYFVQDHEPSFHPVGALSVLAEDTYRMGFHAITAGAWLSGMLRADFGMQADPFEFGCDLSSYTLAADRGPRRGVAFYARPGAPRRAFELGLMALEVFARRNPEVELHLYGDAMGALPFRFVDHGHVTPAQLNDIYNDCFAGLSLSLTNVSLVPHEMLAAGCIPVVNDAEHNRIVLDNPFVHYARLTPHALASALESVLTTPDFPALSRDAAASVRSASWDDAGAAVERIFRRGLPD